MNFERQIPAKKKFLTSLILSAKKEYGDSAAFFSSFFPCSRCSAAVRKVALAPEPANAFEFPFPCELVLFFPFFFGSSSSSSSCSKSSSSADEAPPDRREAPKEREDEDLMDLVSTSESEGTIKSSSSSEALERARPVYRNVEL